MKLPNTPRKTRNKMAILGIHRISKVVTAIVLSLVAFNFLHSELGFLDYDGGNQACRNYCEVIKNADTYSKILREELPSKLKLNKVICIHCFEEIEAQAVQTCFEITDHNLKAKPFNDLYLFNRILLI